MAANHKKEARHPKRSMKALNSGLNTAPARPLNDRAMPAASPCRARNQLLISVVTVSREKVIMPAPRRMPSA